MRVRSRIAALLLLAVLSGARLGGQSGVPAIELISATPGGAAGGGSPSHALLIGSPAIDGA